MGVDTINLIQHWDKWRTLVNTALQVRVAYNAESFCDWLLKEDCSMQIR